MQHSEYKFRLTLSQCPTASGCSETAGACWQQSPTSLSTWPTHSWSTQQGILLIKKEKKWRKSPHRLQAALLHQEEKAQTGGSASALSGFCVFMHACFGLQFSFSFQEHALKSRRAQVSEWGSCTDDMQAVRGKRDFFFLLLHCHTMIWQSKMTHDVTEKNEWDCVGIIWLLTTWKVDPPLQTDISWAIICAVLRLFVASCN